MGKVKDYVLLHMCIVVFSLTSVFAKFAANRYNAGGLKDPGLYFFGFLMLLVCAVYAFFWQKVIKNIDLHVAYANRSVYLIWAQIWAVAIFSEHLTTRNIIGLIVVLIGVIIVSYYSVYDDDEEEKTA